MFGCCSDARICRSARKRRAVSPSLHGRPRHFDRDAVAEKTVVALREIDVPHPAFADLLDQTIRAHERSDSQSVGIVAVRVVARGWALLPFRSTEKVPQPVV